MNLINRLICYVMGHRRKRVKLINASDSLVDVGINNAVVPPGHKLMECPRCLATWTRKVKAKTIS